MKRITRRSTKEHPENRSQRVYGLFFLATLVALFISFKLYSLQVSAYSYYKELADNQHSIFKELVPTRGEIFFQGRDGLYPVAVNKDTKMAYAVPKEVENVSGTIKFVSQTLGLDEGQLKDKLSNPEDMYEVLKHRLSDDEINNVNNAQLKGIHLADESYRYYPAGELASNVLGFVGWSGNELGGRYGAENYFNNELSGQIGTLLQNKDNSGSWISTGGKQVTLAKDGDSYVFTIDHIIQYETEKILKSAIEKYKADRGTIIVMESQTGRILSMASYPNFNPNDYQSVTDLSSFRNLAVSDPYECGSVFKAITLASSIDDGKISPDTTYTDTGAVTEAGYTIKNSDLKANGVQTMTQVLEKSLNTGAIFAEKLLGNKMFADYVERFGFGKATGIDLPAESAGSVNNLKDLKRNIQFFTAAFGQGITVTPIQLISAYNAIATGGVLMKPELVSQIIRPDGNMENVAPQEVRRVISQNTANLMSQMLRSVVVNGHGKMANVPGYLVVGKTGTAQVASHDTKGYAEGQEIGSFAGFAPLDNPRFTILVRMDNPKTVQWAESSAAPTFGELMKFLLDYENIKPTENYTQKDWDNWNQTHTLSQNFLQDDNNDSDNNNNNAKNQ